MKFEQVFVETQVRDLPQTVKILKKLPEVPVREIRKIEDVFGRVRKPYLHKRTALNLYIGRKEGHLVKEAPDAYGLLGEPHFYFIHSYNCIYECEYCYLQGYFKSPDLVLFVNHEEIQAEMAAVLRRFPERERVWFHAGEFSDSLALTSLSQEWPLYWPFFEEHPRAWLELRTKAVNVRPLLQLGPLPNVVVTFSLSPEESTLALDRGTPGLGNRLAAMSRLAKAGFTLGVHYDPVVYRDDLESAYRELTGALLAAVPEQQIAYISVGVVRFTHEVFLEFKRNYPESTLLKEEMSASFDNKIRYPRPQRLFMLKTIRDACLELGVSPEKVYLCMEEDHPAAQGGEVARTAEATHR
ncbi:MAG TPA: hypothetical protein PKV71_03905 [Calditrichia bacterium]|nr:hypothetical protein [Calditrichota bacterium]HQU71914.1 hypothetical protein [Calditrichia bacterium]HQV30992.1 hypothetical protein [Calditrichia bacterium]